jgi:hypothetical protein
VRVAGEDDVALVAGDPLLDATVVDDEVAPPTGVEIWAVEDEVDTAEGPMRAEQRLWRRRDGTLVLRTGRGALLGVDEGARRITVAGADRATKAQLVAAYGLPLLLPASGSGVLVHGSAAAHDGRAVVVTGASGRGKSSVLIRLLDKGWSAITEDVCSIDLRARPVAWPGPPWVRRARGEPGPERANVRFETLDKVAWDIEPRLERAPTPVALVVVLDEPGGTAPEVERLARPHAVAALADQGVWLAEADAGPAALFGPLATLAGAVPVARVRLPRDASWLDAVPGLLGDLLAAMP